MLGASLKDKDNDLKFQFNYTKSSINDYVDESTLGGHFRQNKNKNIFFWYIWVYLG
jgi:hypothetical protein